MQSILPSKKSKRESKKTRLEGRLRRRHVKQTLVAVEIGETKVAEGRNAAIMRK